MRLSDVMNENSMSKSTRAADTEQSDREYIAQKQRRIKHLDSIKAKFSIDDIAIRGTVIYKSDAGYKRSVALTKSGNKIKCQNGDTIDSGDVVSTDASDWRK